MPANWITDSLGSWLSSVKGQSMILSSAGIHAALDVGRLIIEPEPKPRIPTIGSDHCPYDSHSVDLTLPEIAIPKPGPFAYDLTQPGLAAFLSNNSDKHTIEPSKPYQLERNQFILGITRESVCCQSFRNSTPVLPPESRERVLAPLWSLNSLYSTNRPSGLARAAYVRDH